MEEAPKRGANGQVASLALANPAPQPSRNSSLFLDSQRLIPLEDGRQIVLDDVLYGYDVLFETQRLFRMTRWLGTVASQDPMDAWIIQEVLMDVQPDIVIELGTFKGGGALFYASIMRFYADHKPDAMVVTVDPWPVIEISGVGIKIWRDKVMQIEGNPKDPAVLRNIMSVVEAARSKNPALVVMVIEDSTHSYKEVMENINIYWKFVTSGSYLLVQDTKLKRLGNAGITKAYKGRNNPHDAVTDFLREHGRYFEVDRSREYLYYTQHPGGWLRRTDHPISEV